MSYATAKRKRLEQADHELRRATNRNHENRDACAEWLGSVLRVRDAGTVNDLEDFVDARIAISIERAEEAKAESFEERVESATKEARKACYAAALEHYTQVTSTIQTRMRTRVEEHFGYLDTLAAEICDSAEAVFGPAPTAPIREHIAKQFAELRAELRRDLDLVIEGAGEDHPLSKDDEPWQ